MRMSTCVLFDAKMARRIVNHGEEFSDDSCRYKWKWSWMNEVWQPLSPDSTAVRYGQWLRKLSEPGKSYCILCRLELNYANRGVVVFHKHVSSDAHKQRVLSESSNYTLPGNAIHFFSFYLYALMTFVLCLCRYETGY